MTLAAASGSTSAAGSLPSASGSSSAGSPMGVLASPLLSRPPLSDDAGGPEWARAPYAAGGVTSPSLVVADPPISAQPLALKLTTSRYTSPDASKSVALRAAASAAPTAPGGGATTRLRRVTTGRATKVSQSPTRRPSRRLPLSTVAAPPSAGRVYTAIPTAV